MSDKRICGKWTIRASTPLICTSKRSITLITSLSLYWVMPQGRGTDRKEFQAADGGDGDGMAPLRGGPLSPSRAEINTGKFQAKHFFQSGKYVGLLCYQSTE